MSRMINSESVKDSATRVAVGVAVILLTLTFATLFSSCSIEGPKGSPGLNGMSIVGPQGPAGTSCSVLQADDGTGALITCGESSAFIKNGAVGPQGIAGQNATSVTLVKLCPNIQGSYNNFPEFAFKVDGKLYATMSANGVSFTTLLYPGTYTTTSNGANCTFVVKPDYTLQ